MPHFSVLVVCPPDTTHKNAKSRISERMALYDENNKTHFYNAEKELFEDYITKGTERIIMPDGRILLPWDEEFRKEVPIRFSYGPNTHEVPAHLEKRFIPFKETYATVGEFVRDWHGEEFIEKENAHGHYYNPLRKWDYWKLGWAPQHHRVITKPYVKVNHMISSVADFQDGRPGGRFGCDGCRKADIDLDWMREQNIREVQERWNRMKADEEQNVITCLYKHGFEQSSTLEAESCKAASCPPLRTFALVKDGRWHERGEGTSLGCKKGAISDSEWNKAFQQHWDEIPDDSVVVVVDCHV